MRRRTLSLLAGLLALALTVAPARAQLSTKTLRSATQGTTTEQELTDLLTTLVVSDSTKTFLAVYTLAATNTASASSTVTVNLRLVFDGGTTRQQTLTLGPGTSNIQIYQTHSGLGLGSHTWRVYATVNTSGGATFQPPSQLFVGNVDGTSLIDGFPVVPSTTVGTLPAAGTAGHLARLTDGTAAGALVLDNGGAWTCLGQAAQQLVNIACPPYNAVGDNSTDNLAALTAAFAAAANKTLYIPTGIFRTSGTVPITSPMTIFGNGGLLSELSSTSATLPTLAIATDLPVIIRGVRFSTRGGVTKTAGGHIRIAGATGASNNSRSMLEQNSFGKHLIGLDIQASSGLTVRDNDFLSDVAGAVDISLDNVVNADAGDSRILNNSFDAQGAATTTGIGVRQLAAGGAQIVNNKFHHHLIQYQLNARAGAVTGQLYLTGNSFDTFGATCLRIEGAGAYTAFVVANNIFTTCTTGVVLDGGKQNGTLTGNVFWNDTTMVDVVTATDWTITGNTFQNGTLALNVQAGAIRVKWSNNDFADVATVVANASPTSGPGVVYGAAELIGATADNVVASYTRSVDGANAKTCTRIYSTNPAFWWDWCQQDDAGGGTQNGLAFVQRSGIGPGTRQAFFDLNGNLLLNSLKTTGAAGGGKKMVCVDTSTGQLYASSSDTGCVN